MENKFSVDSIIRWVAIVALGVTPIVFLPITQDFYDTNKLTILAAAACILSILSGIRYLTHKNPITFHVSNGVIAFSGLLIASLVSLFVASTNKVDALMAPLGLVSLLSLTIILLTLSRPSRELKTRLSWVLVGSSAILGLIALYQFVGMGRVMLPGTEFLQDALWTPTSATTTTIAVFAVTTALILSQIRNTIGKPHMQNALVFYIASILVIAAGLALTLIQFIPKIASSVIPLPAAWTITLETLKYAKAAVSGAGVENFVSAYTANKPLSMMATGLWNMRFGVNADLYLHMTTIYGLLGLVAALIFTWQFIKQFRTSHAIVNVVYVLCLFLVPPTLTLLTIGAVLLVLSGQEQTHPSQSLPLWVRYIFGVILLALGAGGLYFVGRAYQGERNYFAALSAAQKSEGTNTYNLHIAAIRTNPRVTRYHITFSQINLSLANSVASNTNTQSDQNKALASQLVQQAISEAKIAVTLNPQSITAWENLGATYQALMPVAQGSDTWAGAAYQKALSLDPTNPVLTVNLGGVLVHEGKYDDAILAFDRAIFLKPDYANAYYNLANAYKLKGDRAAAAAAFTKTMSFVQPDSSDYAKVKYELDALEQKSNGTPPAESSGSSKLTLPQ